MIRKPMAMGVLAAALCGAVTHEAAAQTPADAIFTYRYNHIANGQYYTYFDFSASSSVAGHLNFKTFTSPDHQQAVKFVDLKQYTNGASKCLDYTIVSVGGRTPDIKLWANTGTANAPTWVKLSDDSGFNAHVFPRARVWITGSVADSPTRLRLAAYSSGHNEGDFFLSVLDTGQTRASCLAAPANAGAVALENGTISVTTVGP